MKNRIELFIKILIYSIFFVPLILLPSTFIFPFIVPKVLWMRSLIELMMGGYILLLIINWHQYRPKITPLNLVMFLYILSFSLSTFFGVDYYHSLWDNYERMLGLFTIFHYIIFYFIAGGILREWLDWKIASRVFLFAGFLVMFIGWLQTQNPQLLLNNGSERVMSTLGNPIYVGDYGMFLFFLALLLFIREKNNLWKTFYCLAGFFGVMGIIWSGTRGAVLGMAAAVSFGIVSYIVFSKDSPRIRYGLLGLSFLFLSSLATLYYYKNTDFVKNIPAVGRAINTSFVDIKGSPRWIAWGIAIESWKERPIFGWGPNNYFYAFNKYYKAKSLDFGYQETWFDNAHNIILNTLSVQGAIGLLIYLSVFVVAIVSLTISFYQGKLDKKFVVISSTFLVAHFFGNITVFENPTSYLYFMFWLAMISSLTAKSGDEKKEVDSKIITDKKLNFGTIFLVFVSIFIFIFIFNIRNASANQKNLLAIRNLSSGFSSGNLEVMDSLSFSSPHIDDTRSNIGRAALDFLSANWQKLDKTKVNNLFDLVIQNLEKNLLIHPLDIRNQLLLSQIYQLQTIVNNNPVYLLKMENVLQDALSKSPKRQQIIYSLSAVQMQLNKKDSAIKLLEQTILDNPNVSESYWRLAYIYKLAGQEEKAKKIIDQGVNYGVRFTDQDKKIINDNIINGYIFK